MAEVKRPVGKPPLPLTHLNESVLIKDGTYSDWKTLILTEMGKGASVVEIKALLGISSELHLRLLKDEPEYQTAIKEGKEQCEAWWLKMGRTTLKDKSFNSVLWYMNMKNRFGWRDKQDVTTDGDKLPFTVVVNVPRPDNE